MKFSTSRRSRISKFALLAAVTMAAGLASAANPVWTTAVDGNWTDPTKWTGAGGGGFPIAGDLVTWNDVGQNGNETIYLNGAQAAASLTFANTGTTTLRGGTSGSPATNSLAITAGITVSASAGAVVIGDNAVSPTANVDVDMSSGTQTIANNSANTLILANALKVTNVTYNFTGNVSVGGVVTQSAPGGTTTFNNANNLTIGGFTTTAGVANVLSSVGTGTMTVNGNLTQGAGGTLAIRRENNPGTLILKGTSNMTGSVQITNGVISTAVMTNVFGNTTSSISIGALGTLALQSDTSATFGNGTTAYPIALSNSGATIDVNQVSTPGAVITLGTIAMPGNYTLNFTGGNVGVSLGLITGSTANNKIINNSIAGTQGLTVNGYSETNASVRTVTFIGSGNTTIATGFTQVAANALSVINNTTGTFRFNVNSTHTGNTTLGGTNGTSIIAAATPFGSTGSLILGGGNTGATLTGDGTSRTIPNNLSFLPGAGGNFTIGGSSDLIFNGGLSNDQNNTLPVLIINNSGSTTVHGQVTLSSATGARTFQIQGSGNLLLDGLIRDNAGHVAANLQAINYYGSGTLTLSNGTGSGAFQGVATATATTTMNIASGTAPAVAGGALAATQGNSTLKISGNYNMGVAGGNIALNIRGGNGTTITQGTLSLVDGGINTLTIASSTAGATVFSMGSATNPAILNLEVGATADKITLASFLANIQTNANAGVLVNLTSLGGINGSTQDLVVTNNAAAFTIGTGGNFKLNNTTGNFGGYNLTLSGAVTGKLQLLETANAAPANAYWKGTNNSVWNTFSGGNTNTSNFTTDAAGTTNANGLVDQNTNVFFNASSAANFASTSLGQALTINSLNFNATAATSVGITGANALTIQATAANGNTAGNGITVDASSGAHTISAPVVLGNSQTWTNNSTNTLTVSSVISGAGKALTKGGGGTILLTNANSYDGNTTINNGTLAIGPGGSIGAGSPTITINSGGTLNINGGGSIVAGSGGSVVIAGGTLSGSGAGSVNKPISFSGTGGKLSPGNSPGILLTAGETWTNGNSYVWEVNDWTSNTAGTAFDQIQMSGNLDISGLTTGSFPTNTFKIDITGLTAGNVSGIVPNFDNTISRSWTIATFAAFAGSFNANLFTVDSSNLSNNNALGGGTFSLTSSATSLILNFTPGGGGGGSISVTPGSPSLTTALTDGQSVTVSISGGATATISAQSVTGLGWSANDITGAGITSNKVLTPTTTDAGRLNGTIRGRAQFTLAGSPNTADGTYKYTLTHNVTGQNATTGVGTTFGTAQNATLLSGDFISGQNSVEGAGGLGHVATLLESTAIGGTNSSTDIAIAWRNRSSLESYPGQTPPLPANISSLITDVINVDLGVNAPTTYALQMSYNPALLGDPELDSFLAGHLYLAHMTEGLVDTGNGQAEDSWQNATLDSGNAQPGFLRGYLASDLNTVGSWGVDTSNHLAWVVLPGSVTGQFAVVPEPASLGLLAIGALGLLTRRRR